jgi:hypothetical protein
MRSVTIPLPGCNERGQGEYLLFAQLIPPAARLPGNDLYIPAFGGSSSLSVQINPHGMEEDAK